MSKKHRLSDFEFSINPDTWNQAQDLVQQGAVRSLRELEKQFWVALVEDGDHRYEVEMIVGAQKIKDFSCECWSERRKLMCRHVAAGLLTLRHFLEQRTEEKEAVKSPAKSSLQRLTVQQVLSEIPAEKLSGFIEHYARQDRDFALAFKTWFASDMDNSENAFELVLDAAVSKNPSRQSDFRRLRKTLDELLRQLHSAKNERHYSLIFQIATAQINKLIPLFNKPALEPFRDQLEYYMNEAFDSIITLTSASELSPELREKHWKQLLNWVLLTELPGPLHLPLIKAIAQETKSDLRFEQLIALLDNTPEPHSTLLQNTLLASYAERGLPEACPKVLEGFGEPGTHSLRHLETLAGLGHHKAALLCAENLKRRTADTPQFIRALERTILPSAKILDDKSTLATIYRRRFLSGGDPEYFQMLKSVAGDAWPQQLAELLTALRKEDDVAGLALILAAEGEHQALQTLYLNTGDFRILEEHGSSLEPAFIQKEYLNHLSDHLNEHFGKPASEYCFRKLLQLKKYLNPDQLRSIVKKLVEQFPDRPSLPESLNELFSPRNNKNPVIS